MPFSQASDPQLGRLSVVMYSSSSHVTPSSLSHSSTTCSAPTLDNGAVETCLASSLLIGTSHIFADEDLRKCDRYIVPNHQKTLGVGDIFIIQRDVHTSWADPLSLPTFTAQLTHIVGWGTDQVEFKVKNLNTGCTHHKNLKLPLSLVRLSRRQHISRLLWPFPRCSPNPEPVPPICPVPHHKCFSGVRGDRVPRDSDGLPIWHTTRASTVTTNSWHSGI